MALLHDPVRYVPRLALGLALSIVAAIATEVVGTWALRHVIAVALHVVPVG
jgi:hypothetical protein